jgi:hypothetical protein
VSISPYNLMVTNTCMCRTSTLQNYTLRISFKCSTWDTLYRRSVRDISLWYLHSNWDFKASKLLLRLLTSSIIFSFPFVEQISPHLIYSRTIENINVPQNCWTFIELCRTFPWSESDILGGICPTWPECTVHDAFLEF